MKICSTCKVEKPFTDFYKSSKKPDGHAYQCKPCSDISNAKSRIKHPDKTRQHRKNARDNFIRDMRLFKMKSGCVCCGESEVSCLELHHKDPSVKDIHPANATGRKIFYQEAEKCVVVCANCHRKLHANLISLPL